MIANNNRNKERQLAKKSLISESKEEAALRSALRRQTQLLTADEVAANQIHVVVHKERYREIRVTMKNSCNFVHIFFDKVGGLEGIGPDNLGETS